MKRTTYSILFALMSTGMFAQTTLNHIENFSIGDQVTYTEVTSNDSVSPGKAGKNVKWNFSKLNTVGKEVKQVIESSGPVAGIKNYQMVEANSDSSYVYLNKSNDTLYFVAFYDQTRDFLITYDQGVPFMTYPFSYGQVIMKSGLTRSYTINKMLFNGTGFFKTSFDGTGELKLPGKTYKNVVRIKFEQEFVDVDNTYGSKSKVTTISYAWFDMNTKHSILKINCNSIQSAYYSQTTYSYSILK
jgi:hypothetical protein